MSDPNDPISSHTRTYTGRDVPKGVLYIHTRADELNSLRTGELDSIDSEEPSKTKQLLIDMCSEYIRQSKTGSFDAAYLAGFMNKADDLAYLALESKYEQALSTLSDHEKLTLHEDMENRSKSIVFSRVDWVGLAIDAPDYFLKNIEHSCARLARSNNSAGGRIKLTPRSSK